jgi:hypothetical protein
MCEAAETHIIEELRLAKKRKRPTTLVIHVTGGIIQVMQAELISQHSQTHDKRHVANGQQNR